MKKFNLSLVVFFLMGLCAQSQSVGTESFKIVNPYDVNHSIEETKYFDEIDKKITEIANTKGRSFSGDWINLGPVDLPLSDFDFFGNGSVKAIAFHPTIPGIIYVGTQAGGLWRTSDAGQSWIPLTDYLPTPGVLSILINQNNPDIIYIGTCAYFSNTYDGIGVYKSIDGGESFLPSNIGMEFSAVKRMVMHRSNPDTLLAITRDGLYKSVNGGYVWSRYLIGDFDDIVAHPTDDNIYYACRAGNFYKSTNIGDTWQEVTNGLPTHEIKGKIGVSSANPDYVYYLASGSFNFNGIYLSTDSGESFSLKSDTPNIFGVDCDGGSSIIGAHSFSITVDPNNENVVYAGKINCWKSLDAGETWSMVTNHTGDCGVAAVHSSMNAFRWDPHTDNLYSGNGGGIWFTADNGSTWNNITSGLAISQQYSVSQSRLNPNHIITSCEGNGISTFYGDNWIQADEYVWFYDVDMDHTDTTLSYGCTYFSGDLYRLVNNKAVDLIAGVGINGINDPGCVMSKMCQHETETGIMFIGMKNLWRTTGLHNDNPMWEKIWTNSENGCVKIIEQNPSNDNLLYFSTGFEDLYRSDNVLDNNPQFEDVYGYLPNIEYVIDIETHPQISEVVYVVGKNNIYKSGDKGYTWEDITANLAGRTFSNVAVYDRNNAGGLYVGTNTGIYFKDEHMTEWVYFSENLPAYIEISDIDIYHDIENPMDDRIRAATNGRGLWTSSTYYYEPIADFSVSDTVINQGCSVDFYDLSRGYPHSWSWTFEGGIPATSQDANPTGIIYHETGVFEVSLTIENPDGADSKTIVGLVTVEQGVTPTLDFTCDINAQCSNEPVHFYEESEGCPSNWTWTFIPDNVLYLEGTNENSMNPIVSFNSTGYYTVKLVVSNSFGQSQVIKDDYISIGGQELPFVEDFSGDNFSEMGWEVVNPDLSITWDLTDVESSHGTIETVAWINNYNYPNIEEGERDYLITPILNFSGIENVAITFEYAYAERFSPSDSLFVAISDDCGATWSYVYANGPDGQGVFATSEPTTEFFEPQSSDDWCVSGYGARCPLINLNEWAGKENIKISFESYSKYGNNLYINNVMIDSDVGLHEFNKDIINSFKLLPNPANNQVIILLDVIPESSEIIQVTDLQGNIIMSHEFSSKMVTIDISNLKSGMYFVKLSIGNNLITKKMIVN